MLWSSVHLNVQDEKYLDVKDRAVIFAREFWRFSLFYGRYVATPPWKRSHSK